jgi:hypothetical protein
MRRSVKWMFGSALLALSLAVPALPQAPASTARPGPLPVKVQVVLTRGEGDKKVSSPYTVFTSSSGEVVSLRIGAEVPVNASFLGGQNRVTLQQVGMQIDCTVRGVDGYDTLPPAEGPFKVSITITKRDLHDENLVPPIPQRAPSAPAFYNFTFAGTLILSNGGTAQIRATDILTNETWLADVTVSVKK